MKKVFVVVLLLVAGLYSQAQEAGKKIPLKVLYVGYNPEKPMPEKLTYYMTSNERMPEIYKERMPDFKAFLNKHFTSVQTVDVRDYTTALSEKVDVTIMDAGPAKIPATFNRPMVLMHAMAPNVGLPIGLKFDWYCQCLDADALNVRTSHPIFNTPNKVNLTMYEGETPSSFFNGYQGKTTPKKMPMWKVMTEGMDTQKKYLIGMVSHGEGFDDSPDAEAISGGVCWKNAEAVSIGRHGNYFMWGFAGSPNYMTDEANHVFVNAICYIKKYDRMPAIVKKVQQETRTGIDELIYRLDSNLYEGTIIARREGNERLKKMQQELRDKKAAGEDIGNGENLLKMPLTDDVQSFEDYIKGFVGDELFAQYGTDIAAYHKYYRDNYEYYRGISLQSLELDKDAQQLGISNRQPAILEKAIDMLAKNENPALAKRILERYTTQHFTSAKAWQDWYTKNKAKLFYTESGGFKFMVNTYGKPVEAVTKKGVVAIKEKQPTVTDPVAISGQLVAGKSEGMAEVILNANILKGWHIYAFLSQESPFIVTEKLLELPAGATSDKQWETSAPVAYPGEGDIFVYEGKASFKVQVDCSKLKPSAVIKCGLYYQVCDLNKCFPPKKKIISLVYNPSDLQNQTAAN